MIERLHLKKAVFLVAKVFNTNSIFVWSYLTIKYFKAEKKKLFWTLCCFKRFSWPSWSTGMKTSLYFSVQHWCFLWIRISFLITDGPLASTEQTLKSFSSIPAKNKLYFKKWQLTDQTNPDGEKTSWTNLRACFWTNCYGKRERLH